MDETQGSPGQLLPGSHSPELDLRVLEIPRCRLLLPRHQGVLKGKSGSGIKKIIVYYSPGPDRTATSGSPAGRAGTRGGHQMAKAARRRGERARPSARKPQRDARAKGKALRARAESRVEPKVREVAVRVLLPPQAYRSKLGLFKETWRWGIKVEGARPAA